MSKDEREVFGVTEVEARRLVRLDSAKVNIAPPEKARWFRLVGVRLENGTEEYPEGDEVQTVEPWTPPDMWANITSAISNEILDEIEKGTKEGQCYSAAAQAGEERAAWRLIKSRAPELTEKQCKKVISIWVGSGILEIGPYEDPKTRKREKGLFVKERPD